MNFNHILNKLLEPISVINLTGRVLFKELDQWQFGSFDTTESSIIPISALRKKNTDEIPIQPSFKYNWSYHIQYQFWVEIGWEDYKNLDEFKGIVDLENPKVPLISLDTDPCLLDRTMGDIEIFTEKMGTLRPPVKGMRKLDNSIITDTEVPFFITVWDYRRQYWSCVLINQVVMRSDKSITTIAQALYDGYMGYSKYRQSYTDISIIDDHNFPKFSLLLVSMPNRNIDNPKYIYSTCRVKLDYNSETFEKTLSNHYHQNYAQWNKLI